MPCSNFTGLLVIFNHISLKCIKQTHCSYLSKILMVLNLFSCINAYFPSVLHRLNWQLKCLPNIELSINWMWKEAKRIVDGAPAVNVTGKKGQVCAFAGMPYNREKKQEKTFIRPPHFDTLARKAIEKMIFCYAVHMHNRF